MNSVWVENAERPQLKQLTENIRTDVLVIGGAFVGLSVPRLTLQRNRRGY